MRLRYIFLISILLTISAHLSAQNDRQLVRIGNRFFNEQNYAKAEIEYRKAIASNGGNTQAIYNLGCALQAQKKDSAAIKQYELAGKIETNKIRKSKSYHNIGVICQSHQMYKETILQITRLDTIMYCVSGCRKIRRIKTTSNRTKTTIRTKRTRTRNKRTRIISSRSSSRVMSK